MSTLRPPAIAATGQGYRYHSIEPQSPIRFALLPELLWTANVVAASSAVPLSAEFWTFKVLS